MRQYFLTFLIPVALFGALGAMQVMRYAAGSRRAPGRCCSPPCWRRCSCRAWIELRRDTGTMADQLSVLAQVLTLTGADDRVLDCWTGLYLTRRPAYRYFYLNSDVQRLFDPSGAGGRIAARASQSRRAPGHRGPDCERLPLGVRHYVESEFAPVAGWPFLLLRQPNAADGVAESPSAAADQRAAGGETQTTT